MTKPARFSSAGVDDADLNAAAAELAGARRALLEAHEQTDKRDRREALVAAASRLQLVSRMITEVATRRGGAEVTK